MNKKIFAGLGISLILAIVLFMKVENRTAENEMLDAISWFIYAESGAFEDYDALEFIEITNEMLLQDLQLKAQLAVAEDTLKRKVTLLDHLQRLPESWHKEIGQFQQLLPDQIDDWIKLNAKLDLALSSLDEAQRLAPILAMEEKALNLIEAKLNALNLSIFNIDLSGNEIVHYLHRFALDGEEQLSVFEIDTKSKSVLSYKLIG